MAEPGPQRRKSPSGVDGTTSQQPKLQSRNTSPAQVPEPGESLGDEETSKGICSCLPYGLKDITPPEEEKVDPLPPTQSKLFQYSAVALSIEYLWAAGEILIIPYLLGQGVPVEIAGLVWVINPVVAVFLLPYLGSSSDNCTSRMGRRRPFIIALVALSVVSIVLLVLATDQAEGSSTGTIVVCFLSFALLDVCHNGLLGLTRTLVGDLSGKSPHDVEKAEATYTGLQLAGRLLVLAAGLLPIDFMFPYLAGSYQHARGLFVIGVFLLIFTTLITCISAKEIPYYPTRKVVELVVRVPKVKELTDDIVTVHDSSCNINRFNAAQKTPNSKPKQQTKKSPPGDEGEFLFAPESYPDGGKGIKSPRTPLSGDMFFDANERSYTDMNTSDDSLYHSGDEGEYTAHQETIRLERLERRLAREEEENKKWWQLPGDLWVLLAVTFIGWVANLAQNFYWTSWISLDSKIPGTPLYTAFTTLFIDAIFGILSLPLIVRLNELVGAFTVLIAAETLFLLALVMTRLATDVWWAQCVLAGFMGACYAAHSNNPYVVCEGIMRRSQSPARRGLYSGLVNATLTAAQLLVGSLAGLCVKALGNSTSTFFFVLGLSGLGMLVLVCGVHCLARRRAPSVQVEWKHVVQLDHEERRKDKTRLLHAQY